MIIVIRQDTDNTIQIIETFKTLYEAQQFASECSNSIFFTFTPVICL